MRQSAVIAVGPFHGTMIPTTLMGSPCPPTHLSWYWDGPSDLRGPSCVVLDTLDGELRQERRASAEDVGIERVEVAQVLLVFLDQLSESAKHSLLGMRRDLPPAPDIERPTRAHDRLFDLVRLQQPIG